MASSSPQKLTFTSFKKESKDKVPTPQPSTASEIGNVAVNRLYKLGFKSLVALNLGLCAYLLFKEPPKRRNMDVIVVNDASGSKPDVLPQISMQTRPSFSEMEHASKYAEVDN